MRQVTTNVYADLWTHDQIPIRGCNSSFVITSQGIVVIDTPYLPTDAVKWRDEIAKKGEVRFIINTEHHRDHITGNYFIPGTVVSSQGVRAAFGDTLRMSDVRQRVKERDPEGLYLLENYQPRPPTITFSHQMDIYLGDHTFKLIHLPGHTPGQVGVYIPQERVVFTGDNFTNGWQPSLEYCCPLEWVESLKRIEAMDFDVVVPGHGGIGDRKGIRAFREFIQKCIDVVRRAINEGMSKEEAADRISFETGEYPPALHPGPEWQRRNVLRLYDMLRGSSTNRE